MKDADCVQFLQWALPKLRLRWPGFRKVRRQVCKRLDRRLRHLGLEDVAAYRDYLNVHLREWSELDELCRISISRFYRDRSVFDLLRNRVMPQIAAAALARGNNTIHAWSAGCASGEEVYTLNMVWVLGVQQEFPGMSLDLVATDADRHLIERAKRACYPQSSVKDFPREWIPLAFYKSGEQFCVRDRFRERIRFLLQDIRRELPATPFDLICCRHVVFTYFDEKLQTDLLQQLMARLGTDGILVIGKQETLPSAVRHDLRLVEHHSGVYGRHSVSGDQR